MLENTVARPLVRRMLMLAVASMVALMAYVPVASAQTAENTSEQNAANFVGEINATGGDNNAAISDDDTNTAVGGAGGDAAAVNAQLALVGGDQEANATGGAGGDANLSDDDANAIVQENNTAVNVEQGIKQSAFQKASAAWFFYY